MAADRRSSPHARRRSTSTHTMEVPSSRTRAILSAAWPTHTTSAGLDRRAGPDGSAGSGPADRRTGVAAERRTASARSRARETTASATTSPCSPGRLMLPAGAARSSSADCARSEPAITRSCRLSEHVPSRRWPLRPAPMSCTSTHRGASPPPPRRTPAPPPPLPVMMSWSTLKSPVSAA
eukprot:scaffold16853_cov104-Isochrysis_galbana.AAC.4